MLRRNQVICVVLVLNMTVGTTLTLKYSKLEAQEADNVYDSNILKMTALTYGRESNTITEDEILTAYTSVIDKEIKSLEDRKHVTADSIKDSTAFKELIAKLRPDANLDYPEGQQFNIYMLLVFHGRDFNTITDDEITQAAYTPIQREIKRLEDIKSTRPNLKLESNSKLNNNIADDLNDIKISIDKEKAAMDKQNFEDKHVENDKKNYNDLYNFAWKLDGPSTPNFEAHRSNGDGSGEPGILVLITAILIVAGQY